MSFHEKNVITKYPFKRLYFSIHNSTAAIPHQIDLLKQHNCRIQEHKKSKNLDLLHKEQINACNVIRQLRQIVVELDKMKYQVIDEDYALIEKEIEPIISAITDDIKSFISSNGEINEESGDTLNELHTSLNLPSPTFHAPFPSNFFQDDSDNSTEWQVLSLEKENRDPGLHVNNEIGDMSNHLVPNARTTILETEELNRQMSVLNNWEVLRGELTSLNSMVHSLSSVNHKEKVENIEAHVENTEDNVTKGIRSLQKASYAKAATYPVAGAVCGGIIGGPVGFVMGMKCGFAVAAIGGLFGYYSGRFLKQRTQTSDELEMLTYNSPENKEDKKNK